MTNLETKKLSNWVSRVKSVDLGDRSFEYTLKAIVACMRDGVDQEDEDMYWQDLAIILSAIANEGE